MIGIRRYPDTLWVFRKLAHLPDSGVNLDAKWQPMFTGLRAHDGDRRPTVFTNLDEDGRIPAGQQFVVSRIDVWADAPWVGVLRWEFTQTGGSHHVGYDAKRLFDGLVLDVPILLPATVLFDLRMAIVHGNPQHVGIALYGCTVLQGV